MHTILGTPYYVAPEVLKGDYNEKCDVWSLGAISYIMLSGEPPFNGNSNHEIFNKVINSEVSFEKKKWKQVSQNCIDFISKCLIKNPDYRFSASEASEHPWFKDILNEIHASKNLDSEILENLKNFSSPSRFKKLVLRFLINQLSRKEIKKLRDAFYAIDVDHRGQINIDELDKAFKLAGVKASPQELKNIIESSENHRAGVIDYTEFLVASMNQKKIVDKEKLISAFNYFDIDGSGYICSSDLKNVLLRSGKKVLKDEDIDSMLVEVTNMKDQKKISLSEFLGLFNFK
jgi:calcium-dependent protein kinase